VYKVYEKWLESEVKKGSMPSHLGIILDGNRRWARERNLDLKRAYMEGANKAEEVLEWCRELGIKTVTLYVLSHENFLWRKEEEKENIFSILKEKLLKYAGEMDEIQRDKVKIKFIGRTELLPQEILDLVSKLEEETKENNKYFLNIALVYGGRLEIIDSFRKLAAMVKRGELSPDEINEDMIFNTLYTAHLPNPEPDLIIRTSGEERLSGFLLWQSAYSELIFIDCYWPDFRRIDFLRCVRVYQKRSRRFGT